MEILTFVKDLVLDFANKMAKSKCNGGLERERDIIKNDFLSKMLLLRDKYPELLFINYPSDINEKDAKAIFYSIKESVKDVYDLDKLVCPQFYSCNIEGINLEIPGIQKSALDNNYGGVYNIDYNSIEDKIMCINLVLLHSLMLLPIKKISLSFVDLKRSYEYELFLRNLPSKLYNEKPITTDEQMERLLSRLEKRREEIITRYGNYVEYCKKTHSIPLPYEVVVLYDESFDKKYYDRLNSLIEWCKRIGIIIIIPRKKSLKSSKYLSFYDIINPNGKECYKRKGEKDSWKCEYIEPKYTGLFLNHDIITSDGPGEDLRPNKSVTLIEDLQRVSDDNNVIIGSGDYEVTIEINNDSFAPVPNEIINAPHIASFLTENDAIIYKDNYIHNYMLMPPIDVDFYRDPYVRLRNSDTGEISQGIVLPKYYIDQSLLCYSEDILFYLSFIYNDRMKGNLLNKGKFILRNGKRVCEFDSVETRNEQVLYFDEEDFFTSVKSKVESKWGKDYMYHHLFLRDIQKPKRYYEPPYKVIIRKNEHITIPVEHYEIPKNDGIINFTPVTSNETLLKACFDYIRTEAETKDEMKVQSLDFDSAAESKYETDLSTMIIPVGKTESIDAVFRMDLVSHVHSFIIGQSGSGKSVFLHNIIGGAMLKYAPEDLQLYLLDFKLGGVEFNRYQGAKHVKALLVDNSDPQVTLEILRELRNCMTERGKLLRSAGVNNIGEYNKLHQQERMSHVLVVADECHEMFKADDSIPRQVRNGISDIVIKIAKEGRSQGVHLVFATQTLSGTEISSEIINNVSDFYLLKCAQTDSERLVPNSSSITSELSTGQIYYHHVDEQVKFQAYYTDREAAERLMAAIVEKAKDHKSNGEFYFNGAQMFHIDESVKEQMMAMKGKSPVAFMGKAIDISQKDLYIKLNEDFSENVLLLGLNDQEQVTRITMNMLMSLMMSAKLKHKDIDFKVIDCLNNEEGEVHELIFDLEDAGCCEIIGRRQRSKFFKELAQGIQEGTAEETILLILGQDRFRELKMDLELEDTDSRKSSDDDDAMSISDDFFGGGGSSSSSSVRTYREALNVILDKGPDCGVHTLLQLEKASNLLFEDYITPKVVFQKFKHLVMLKSDETAGVTLHLNDEIRLEKLSSDWERLRAYYYAEESDSYTLFTPYMPLKTEEMMNLLKS